MTAPSTLATSDSVPPGLQTDGDEATRHASGEVTRAAALGVLSLIVIAITSAMRGWPFPTLTASPWFYQFSTSNDLLKYAVLGVFFLGVAGLCRSWMRLLRHATAGHMSVRRTIGILAMWTVPLLLAAPLFSGDVYVYLTDGDVLNRGFDPYETGISAMGPADTVYMIHPLWRDTTSMYGPVFMRAMQGIAHVAGGDVVAGVMMIRGLVLISVVIMVAAVISLARTLGRNPAEALVFAVLNPLSMLHLIGGAHNDGTMLSLLLAGFAVGVKAQGNGTRASSLVLLRLAAILLCVAGAAFKIPALAGVLVLGWIWAGPGPSIVRRMVGAALAGVVGLVVFEICTLLTGLGWGWTNALDVPGLAHPLLAPANAVAMSFGRIFGVSGGLNEITRVIATVVSLGLAVFFVLRTGRYGSAEEVLRASGWAFLAIAWLGPAVYPWYLAWGIAVVGVVGAKAMHKIVIGIVVVVSFLVAPGGYGMLDHFGGWLHTVVAFFTVGVMSWLIWRIIQLNSEKWPRKREV